jgi:RimJ/RimL family protein N-acetyltransferase
VRAEWSTPVGELTVFVPRIDDVGPHLAALVAAYNDPRNAPLLGHSEAMTAADVVEHYTHLLATGGYPFILARDGNFAGDADLRGVRDGAAEFAFLVADPGAQGKGLGTRFATMIHALAFARLGLERVYASVIPSNTASRRVFEKLGYVLDDSAAAREFADDEGDVTLVLDAATFANRQSQALREIVVR